MHKHEWEWGHNLEFGSHIRRKDNVSIRMSDDEALRRINATEELSAEIVHRVLVLYQNSWATVIVDALRAYAERMSDEK